ncbi:MAG TPA: hypothetical protein VK659_27640 [Asanoa sp.]|nr:hypothetical protein [Asanoa sp.]
MIGLGTVWILDGLEVTIVGNLSGQLSKPGSGIDITQSQITGLAAALYVAGACVGRCSSAGSPTCSAARNSSSSRWPSTWEPRP